MDQDVTADEGVVRSLSLAQALLHQWPRGLTRKQLFNRVEQYVTLQRELEQLSGAALERKKEARDKSFTRDKRMLIDIGIPVEETGEGEEIRYRISPQNYGLAPLELTPAEQLALQRAELFSSDRSLGGLGHALWALAASDSAQDAGEGIGGSLTGATLHSAIGTDTEVQRLISLSSLGMGRPVSFEYTSRGRSEPRRRRVVPLGVGIRQHWYLFAHDLDAASQRIFRLDRIRYSPEKIAARRLNPEEAEVVEAISSGQMYADFDAEAQLNSLDAHYREQAVAEGALRAHTGQPTEHGKLVTATPQNSRLDNQAARTERVINMISLLLARPEGVEPSRLMAQYGISADQLHRDLLSIHQLSTAGFGLGPSVDVQPAPPLTSQEFEQQYLPTDEPITLWMGDDRAQTCLQRPVSLTKPGALSLLITLQALIEYELAAEDHLREAAESLRHKVLEIAPASIAEAAASLVITRPADQRAVADQLQGAIEGRYAVELNYADAAGTESQRVVDPVHLVFHGPFSYLRAWCHRAVGERYFRLDRIGGLTSLTQQHQSEQAAELSRQHGNHTPEVPRTEDSIEVVLRFSPSAAAEAELYRPEKSTTDPDTGARTIQTHFSSQQAVVEVCLRAGGDIELLRPESLRAEIRRRAAEAL